MISLCRNLRSKVYNKEPAVLDLPTQILFLHNVKGKYLKVVSCHTGAPIRSLLFFRICCFSAAKNTNMNFIVTLVWVMISWKQAQNKTGKPIIVYLSGGKRKKRDISTINSSKNKKHVLGLGVETREPTRTQKKSPGWGVSTSAQTSAASSFHQQRAACSHRSHPATFNSQSLQLEQVVYKKHLLTHTDPSHRAAAGCWHSSRQEKSVPVHVCVSPLRLAGVWSLARGIRPIVAGFIFKGCHGDPVPWQPRNPRLPVRSDR